MKWENHIGAIGTALLLLALLELALADSDGHRKTEANQAKAERSILCDDKRLQSVRVAFGRLTVINFPFKPKEVVPGEAAFDFRQIKNDLIVKPLRPRARTNVMVYLDDRRCAFEMNAVASGGDDILIVRDPKESQFEVKPDER